MKHSEPELVTPKLLAELRRITPYDPDHLPREIALIEAFRERHPKMPQVACFDTAFRRFMPRVAKLLANYGVSACVVARFSEHFARYLRSNSFARL